MKYLSFASPEHFLRAITAVVLALLLIYWMLIPVHWIHQVYASRFLLGIQTNSKEIASFDPWDSTGECHLPDESYQWGEDGSSDSSLPTSRNLPDVPDNCPILALWNVTGGFTMLAALLTIDHFSIPQDSNVGFLKTFHIQPNLLESLSPRAPPVYLSVS